MKRTFAERNLAVIGTIGLLATAALVVVSTQYDKVPGLSGTNTYSAYFADAGAMRTDTNVQVSGHEVGKVTGIELDGAKVKVTFTVDDDIRLGDRTEVAIKTETLLGAKIVDVVPRGEGELSGPVPLERTRSPYQLPDALGDVTATVKELDTDQLSESLATLSETLKDTPPDLRVAVEGLTRFSKTINNRDEQLRALLANANKATTVLAKRTDQVVALIRDTNALLAELLTESNALDSLAGHLSGLSRELSGLVADNREQLKPALDKLNGVLTIVDDRKDKVQESIKLLNSYALSLGESVSSGPFFNAYIANLLPGQFVQPFIDAAFSDLGLDPNTKLPSELTDPQIGQAGTPALPVPYPRTGQGGDPHLTLPDAITGNPGDQGCGPPGLPLPGPTGCYPYREPEPPGPPGGPPPGPPAPAPPGLEMTTPPTPAPIYEPAPNEPGAPPPAEPLPGSPTGVGGMP
jgi:phospholipid/cholesterol/gamma-HCH transport system substrate-binding protein